MVTQKAISMIKFKQTPYCNWVRVMGSPNGVIQLPDVLEWDIRWYLQGFL